MYNKLFTKILDSSIWLENQPTRIVWVTFIACMDQDGTVALSSIGNVANRARVSFEEAAEAIRCLESPDEHNPDQDHDGRRIERIPGLGWAVLNAQKYRDIVTAETVRAQNRERQRNYRSRQNNADETPCHDSVTESNENVTPSEAYAETDKEKDISIDISKKKATTKKLKLTDDEWLDTLASTEVYKGIDVRREFSKASLWCDTNSRQCTRKFFINWLNRATPMSATAMSTSLPSPSSAKEQKAHERKNAYDNLRNFVDSAAEHVPGPNAADRPQQLSGPNENDPLRRGSGNGNGVVTSLAPLDPRIPLAGSV